MNKIQGKEKRQFKRLSAYHLVKYRLSSGSTQTSAAIIVGAKDIGAGGLCIETKENIPVDSILELTVNFPPNVEPLRAKAKVKWVKKLKSIQTFLVGLEFIDINDNLRRDILSRVDSIYKITDSGSQKK
jgi:c-di-GMP-binding flagellar brake protein YcgR